VNPSTTQRFWAQLTVISLQTSRVTCTGTVCSGQERQRGASVGALRRSNGRAGQQGAQARTVTRSNPHKRHRRSRADQSRKRCHTTRECCHRFNSTHSEQAACEQAGERCCTGSQGTGQDRQRNGAMNPECRVSVTQLIPQTGNLAYNSPRPSGVQTTYTCKVDVVTSAVICKTSTTPGDSQYTT
jgi:hypothetical protein